MSHRKLRKHNIEINSSVYFICKYFLKASCKFLKRPIKPMFMGRVWKKSRYGVCRAASYWCSTLYLQSTYDEWGLTSQDEPNCFGIIYINRISKLNGCPTINHFWGPPSSESLFSMFIFASEGRLSCLSILTMPVQQSVRQISVIHFPFCQERTSIIVTVSYVQQQDKKENKQPGLQITKATRKTWALALHDSCRTWRPSFLREGSFTALGF